MAQFDDGKDQDALRTIGEVAKATGIKAHVLRYWEQQFPMLKPLTRSGGRRYYRPEDIELIERIEGGLLSYGNDMTRDNTPHECGLGRFCNTQTAIGCVGRDALLRVAKEGPVRQICALEMSGARVPGCTHLWPVMAGDRHVGNVSSAAWSPDHGTNVAIGMVRMTHWEAGTQLVVRCPGGDRDAVVREGFWA